MKIKLIRFRDDLIPPKRQHYNDAGIDCYAQTSVLLKSQSSGMCHVEAVGLGFGLEIPDGYMAVLKPRSSMNAKGIITQIGTIDSGYRGEIKGIFLNPTGNDVFIQRGERLCQLVIEPVVIADLADELGDERGEGGFGSTGR